MIPVEKNKEYEIKIVNVSDDGNGVGRIDGYTVFIPAAVTGDTVRTLIVKVKTHYAYGKALEIIKPSPYRVKPVCKHSVKCGGCSFMHISYDYQLKLKKDFICECIKRIAGIDDFEFDEIIGTENPLYYRNKMIFPIEQSDNKAIFGFYAKKSHRVIELDTCFIGNELCSRITACITEFMTKNNIPAYNEETHSGLVRRVFLRTSHSTGEIMTVIVINGKVFPKHEQLVTILTEKFPSISSVMLNINTEKTNLVLGAKNKTIFGKDYITDTICGNAFKISPHSFLQINPVQTGKLYNKCLEYANIAENETVMDVYCGAGTISLAAAKNAKSVIGIEIVEEAIKNAKENALANNISNAEFYAGSADKLVPYILKSGVTPDVVILDPPRKGSDEITLSAIVKASPKRISYVSCNPSTLARDIKFLTENGYKREKVSGVDMFPHTTHVESVALLTLSN